MRLAHGPGWDSSRQIRDQDAWDEPAAFMDGLVDDGFLILGGPVGDGEETLHVIEAANEREIRARLAKDPWAQAGMLRIARIEPWALWLDSRPWVRFTDQHHAPRPDDAHTALHASSESGLPIGLLKVIGAKRNGEPRLMVILFMAGSCGRVAYF